MLFLFITKKVYNIAPNVSFSKVSINSLFFSIGIDVFREVKSFQMITQLILEPEKICWKFYQIYDIQRKLTQWLVKI